MICELCGKAVEKVVRVRLEGSEVSACKNCASLGEQIQASAKKRPRRRGVQPRPPPKPKTKPEFKISTGVELVDNYSEVIRARRQSLGLKQSDLGKIINEPASLIQRLESNRFRPSPELARKLEHKLRIKLLKREEDEGLIIPSRSAHRDLTLGDLVVVKKRRGS